MATALHIPRNKELHAVKLASGRGRYSRDVTDMERAEMAAGIVGTRLTYRRPK